MRRPLIAVIALALIAAGACRMAMAARAPRPPQPFTVDLLDSRRGQWHFDNALGQELSLPGPVSGFAFTGASTGSLALAYLCCDPEFPGDRAHAELRRAEIVPTALDRYRIREPYFSAMATLTRVRPGVVRCELRDIHLGPAVTGDRYVESLTILSDGVPCPLWLAPDDTGDELAPRLLTDRVGGVFTASEPIRVTLAASWTGEPAVRRFTLRCTELATGRAVRLPAVDLRRTGGLAETVIRVQAPRYGVHELVAACADGATARVRITRVPEPRRLDPERSAFGINIFQQQIWWYAHQAPLMAAAGVRWIRPWLAWENTWGVMQPGRSRWDTRALDAALRRMGALGQRYQCILWGAPEWVPHTDYAPLTSDLQAWSAYVSQFVRRYRGRIRHYEVWNEPDLMWSEATRHSGEAYARMLEATFAAAKHADPTCRILGLSHAGYEDWLLHVGARGAARWFDIATIHTYARPSEFRSSVEQRLALLRRSGMGSKPVWVNELGSTAYDFSPGYSRAFQCSERRQAADLPVLYAETFAASPGAKAFWFCTYDPRDAAHETDWTSDAGIGVLYLGFLPKLSYAALAAAAREMDGRACLGRRDPGPGLHAVTFAGPVSVVWAGGPPRSATPASRFGCLPSEVIRVRDAYGNEVAHGRARAITLDLARGPLYIEGSAQMAAIARCETALRAAADAANVRPGATVRVRFTSPPGARPSVSVSPGMPVRVRIERGALAVTAPAAAGRAAGAVRVRVVFPARRLGLAVPYVSERTLEVTTGAPNLIHDGAFDRGDARAWSPERQSGFAWDPQAGFGAPGALRLDGPFDRRLVQFSIPVRADRPLRFRARVRTRDLTGCALALNLSAVSAAGWLGDRCLAATAQGLAAWPAIEQAGRIPTGTSAWTLLDVTAPPGTLPAGAVTVAFFIDARGGTGTVWLDDLDLWQPAPGSSD